MGPRGVAAIVCFVALLAPATASGGTFSGTYTSARYGWDWFSLNGYATADCGNKQPFTGREPDAAGTFPVLLYVPDTTNLHDGRAAQAFLAAAADAGFVAVSAKMTENLFHAAGVDANAMCIASGSRPGSVASQVCARPKADCSKGMVVAGFSQGAVIALRARNHDARVRAAYLIGINEERTTEGGARWRTSMPPPTGTRALANNQVRIVNGEGDSTVARRDELNDITGTTCAVTATSCLNADGSGWYVVRGPQVADGTAGHCYLHNNGDNTLCAYSPMDPNWLHPATPTWGLPVNLDWLKSRTG